jgi:hypothetical protein
MFSWNRKNIVSRRITESGKLQTFSGKIKIKAQPVDQFGWIKFRGPKLMVWSSLQNFRFLCLSIGSQSAGKVFPLEPHFEATRKDIDPKKIPRAYFSFLNLCTKFYPERLTLSALNPQAIRDFIFLDFSRTLNMARFEESKDGPFSWYIQV